MSNVNRKDVGQPSPVTRRDFLRNAGLGAGAATVAAIVPADGSAAPPAAPDHRRAGYRETAHVRRVYDLSRF